MVNRIKALFCRFALVPKKIPGIPKFLAEKTAEVDIPDLENWLEVQADFDKIIQT